MDTNKINQTISNQRHPFLRIVEEFTHGDGNGNLLAQHLEPPVLFWRQGVFQEKEPIRFQLLGDTYSLHGPETLMDIMHQTHLVAQTRAKVLKEARNTASVGIGIEVDARRRVIR